MKTQSKRMTVLLLAAMLLAACGSNAPQETAPAEATPESAVTVAPTKTLSSIPALHFGSVTAESSGKSPDYTLHTVNPVLQGNYPHLQDLNHATADFIQQEVGKFQKNLADWTPVPGMTESSFSMTFTSFPYDTRFASLQFTEETFMAGAAHPGHEIHSLVYDLQNGQALRLEQLFLPNTNYLQLISDFCKAELTKRDIGFDAQQNGADPTAENYSVWNISRDGLVITFNEYQVAAYAAGAQTVIVPYSALKDVIDPQGPLGNIPQ